MPSLRNECEHGFSLPSSGDAAGCPSALAIERRVIRLLPLPAPLQVGATPTYFNGVRVEFPRQDLDALTLTPFAEFPSMRAGSLLLFHQKGWEVSSRVVLGASPYSMLPTVRFRWPSDRASLLQDAKNAVERQATATKRSFFSFWSRNSPAALPPPPRPVEEEKGFVAEMALQDAKQRVVQWTRGLEKWVGVHLGLQRGVSCSWASPTSRGQAHIQVMDGPLKLTLEASHLLGANTPCGVVVECAPFSVGWKRLRLSLAAPITHFRGFEGGELVGRYDKKEGLDFHLRWPLPASLLHKCCQTCDVVQMWGERRWGGGVRVGGLPPKAPVDACAVCLSSARPTDGVTLAVSASRQLNEDWSIHGVGSVRLRKTTKGSGDSSAVPSLGVRLVSTFSPSSAL